MTRPAVRALALVLAVLSSVLTWFDSPASASASFVISTMAGTGVLGYSGDAGPATSAKLNEPIGMTTDSQGNLYIADYENSRIRKVAANGTITTVAGNGSDGYSGDGGPATSAEIEGPADVAFDSRGNMYIAEFVTGVVRKVAVNGIITTFAGNGSWGHAGDGGQATSAELNGPCGVEVDVSDNVYIADPLEDVVRKVASTGIITTVAGNGTTGFSGDSGPATSAQLSYPRDIAFDGNGNLYIGDDDNDRVRKVAVNGTITTVAGTGVSGNTGDGGPATSADIAASGSIGIDSAGQLYISEGDFGVVRRVDLGGTITTVIGDGTEGNSGDGGPATSARMETPNGIVFMPNGDVLVADRDSHLVRKVALLAPAYATVTVGVTVDPAFTFAVTGRGSPCNGQTASGFNTGAVATSVPLGNITAAAVTGGAQDLSVTTNAANGFAVYIRTAGTTPHSLRDGAGHSIADVAGTHASPGAAPSVGTAGFGYTSSDTDTPFTGNTWAKLTNTNATVLVASGGVWSESSCVGYAVAIASTTPAGAYSSPVAYTAIPSF